MNRPKKATWQETDKQLSKLLVDIKNAYDVDAWEFHIPGQNRMARYKEIVDNLNKIYPDKIWLDAIKLWFNYLKEHMHVMNKDLKSIFVSYTRKIEEQVNYIKELEDYADNLETAQKELLKSLSTIEKEHEKRLHEERLKIYMSRESDLSKMHSEIGRITEALTGLARHLSVKVNPIEINDTVFIKKEEAEQFLMPIVDPHPNPHGPGQKVEKPEFAKPKQKPKPRPDPIEDNENDEYIDQI